MTAHLCALARALSIHFRSLHRAQARVEFRPHTIAKVLYVVIYRIIVPKIEATKTLTSSLRIIVEQELLYVWHVSFSLFFNHCAQRRNNLPNYVYIHISFFYHVRIRVFAASCGSLVAGRILFT